MSMKLTLKFLLTFIKKKQKETTVSVYNFKIKVLSLVSYKTS